MSRPSARRVRMAPVDTAWLRMDSPANLMMIVGVDVFEGEPDLPRLRALLRHGLLGWRPFRSRVVVDAAGAWWEEGDVDLDHHLVPVTLDGAGGTRELQHLVARLAGEPLDPARPLWQFHLVERYGDGHALIVRIHHCIADGMALVRLMLSMTGDQPGEDPAPAPSPPDPDRAATEPPVDAWSERLRPLTSAAVRAIDTTGVLTQRALRMLNDGLEDPDKGVALARWLAQAGRDAAALALMDNDTPTALKGVPGGRKAVAWNEPLPLEDVKVVGRSLGASVNDVLMSCVAGALRGYLADRGADLDGAEFRVMVPVNLRAADAPPSLGNHFGLVPLLLPIGIAHPIDRVREVRARMNALKDSTTPMLAMLLLGAMGLSPRAVQRQVLDLLARKATAVVTNVPGPRHALYMAGRRLRQMMFWVPQSGDIGLGVSILSYDGGVQFGLVSDRRLCAEPQAIIDRFAREFENLVHAVLLLPWDDGADAALARRALESTEALAAAARHLAGHATGGPEPAVDAPAPRRAGPPAERLERGRAGVAERRPAAARRPATATDGAERSVRRGPRGAAGRAEPSRGR